MTTPALLVLEDGRTFRGQAYGAVGETFGEAVFNTGMTGYQETLTDPSYHRQVVVMTAPQIGNTGANYHDDQSLKPWAAAFVTRDAARIPSSWRSEESLDVYLERHGVVGIDGVDTRRLTRHLRTRGAMRAGVSSEVLDADELVELVCSSPAYVGRDLVREVTAAAPYAWGREQLEPRALVDASLVADATSHALGRRPAIAAFDFGIKRNILDLLVASGCDVTVLPATASADVVLAGGFDGVFLSNGPGDPEPVDYAIETIASLLGRVPIFGICLGHQLMALALGARTFKLPFGHRGGNHPVKHVERDRVEITCQNHGFAVDPTSVEATPARITHVNLNDQTVEGLEVPNVAFSVQYHPESGPGPHDSRYLFNWFGELMARFEPTEVLERAEGALATARQGG